MCNLSKAELIAIILFAIDFGFLLSGAILLPAINRKN